MAHNPQLLALGIVEAISKSCNTIRAHGAINEGETPAESHERDGPNAKRTIGSEDNGGSGNIHTDGGEDKEAGNDGTDPNQRKKTKVRDDRRFQNLRFHRDMEAFLAQQSIGERLTRTTISSAPKCSLSIPAMKGHRITGYFLTYHGTSIEGLRRLQDRGRWDSHLVQQNRDLTNDFGIYFSSSPEYALIHSILVMSANNSYEESSSLKAIVIENLLPLNETPCGFVREDMMPEFYHHNRTSHVVCHDMPPIIIGEFLNGDANLAAETFPINNIVHGVLVEAFSNLQVATSSVASTPIINQESNIVNLATNCDLIA